MAQYEEQQREYRKARREFLSKKLQQQYEMIISGQRGRCSGCNTPLYYEKACRNKHCSKTTGLDIEPGMAYLRQEFKTMIRLDEQTRNRLEEFARSGESYQDVINRLMGTCSGSEAPQQYQQQQQQQ
jgi:hypothetical protein